MSAALRLGTRASDLATSQSRLVADALTAATGRTVELVPIVTRGDTSDGPIAELGGTGVFVSALREALLADEVDLAVHSLKDLPTAPPDGLVLAAVPEREDPSDVLVARDSLTLEQLPPGATVGTGSPRRAATLRALGQELDVRELRGNVDSRLARVATGELDAVVLARAGLARLGRLDVVTETIDPELLLPAPGQGALAVEARASGAGAEDLLDLLRTLDHSPSRECVAAERAVLAALEAGCTAPVGAHATHVAVTGSGVDEDPQLHLRASVVAVDGSASIRMSATGPAHDAEEVGRVLAAELLAAGAAGLLGERLP